MKKNRVFSFIVIAIVYIIAIIIGIVVFNVMNSNIYIRLLIGEIAATVVVYIVGLIFNNASVYDPYWSVQPIVIAVGLASHFDNFSIVSLLFLSAICFWGVRLTINWAVTFENLNIQDWRYDKFKNSFPRLFPLISLLGIHMFPTLVVYLAVLPAVALLEKDSFNIYILIGFCICLMATFIQLFSDKQMQEFRRNKSDKKELISIGLWKYSRHPNYLGEILMWWGVYVMMLSVAPNKWMLGIGALVNTIMFFVISIPMAEKRNSERPGYAEYKKRTRCLLPLKRY